MRRTTRIVMVGGVVAACLAVAGPAWAAKTVCSTGCLTTSIQAAISIASPGATITIGKGSYYENVVVNKPVTLLGSGVETVIYPATSNPVCAWQSPAATAIMIVIRIVRLLTTSGN